MTEPWPERGHGYEARIEPRGRWLWFVTYTRGLASIECGNFAWSRESAERKANRRMARWKAQDERQRALTVHVRAR